MILKKKKILLSVIIIPLIIILGLFLYLEFGGYLILTKNEREQLISDIKNSPQMPDRFLDIYSVMYPSSLSTKSLMHYVNHETDTENRAYCVCREAVYAYYYPLITNSIVLIPIINYVESNVNQRECLNFYVKNKVRYFKLNPLRHKVAGDMSDIEIIEFLLTLENSTLYDKYRHPEIVQTKVDEILNQLNQ